MAISHSCPKACTGGLGAHESLPVHEHGHLASALPFTAVTASSLTLVLVGHQVDDEESPVQLHFSHIFKRLVLYISGDESKAFSVEIVQCFAFRIAG